MLADDFNKPEFPYFLSHSIGLQPKAARAAAEAAYFSPWARGDDAIWNDWLAAIAAFRASLAPLIGADADDICPQTNVSSALTKVIHSLPPKPGRTKIALAEDDFPTIGFVAAQAKKAGLAPLFLKGGAHLADPDAWAAGLGDDVRLLHITHVFSNTGLRAPVAEIVRRARARGVATVIDAAQSAGAIGVSAAAWGADFLTGTSVKYLCGGPGAAYLWVNPATAADCAPIDVGWFSHENPFEHDIRRFAYAPRAARFWGGTPSVAPYAIATAGALRLGALGAAAIEARNMALFDKVLARLPRRAFISHIAPGEHGASFLLRPEKLAQARKALAQARIAHDERVGALRFSVHLYTDESEIDRLAETLATYV